MIELYAYLDNRFGSIGWLVSISRTDAAYYVGATIGTGSDANAFTPFSASTLTEAERQAMVAIEAWAAQRAEARPAE